MLNEALGGEEVTSFVARMTPVGDCPMCPTLSGHWKQPWWTERPTILQDLEECTVRSGHQSDGSPTCHLQDAMSGHVIEWVICAQRRVLASHGHHWALLWLSVWLLLPCLSVALLGIQVKGSQEAS